MHKLKFAGCALLFATCLPASAATSLFGKLLPPTPGPDGCDWVLNYGPGSPHNFAFPETNALYYEASPPLLPTIGARLRISGLYINARFFSIQLYNGSFQPIDGLADNQLVPDSDSRSTLSGLTTFDPTVPFDTQRYTVYVVFDKKPAQPAPNTLYAGNAFNLGKVSIPKLQKLYLLYRLYLPGDSTQILPQLAEVAADGSASPLPDGTNVSACNDGVALLAQQALASIDTAKGAYSALYSPAPQQIPQFSVYYGGILGGGIGLNTNAHYVSATTSRSFGDLYIVRGRAVSHSDQTASGGVPDLRYWSICQNSAISTSVVDCVPDQNVVVDASGDYNIVVSDDSAAPAGADTAHGFNWLPYGNQDPADLIYRQIQASSEFAPHSIAAVPQGSDPKSVMGDTLPVVTYCARAVFAQHTAAGESPAAVFAACQAGL